MSKPAREASARDAVMQFADGVRTLTREHNNRPRTPDNAAEELRAFAALAGPLIERLQVAEEVLFWALKLGPDVRVVFYELRRGCHAVSGCNLIGLKFAVRDARNSSSSRLAQLDRERAPHATTDGTNA